jgi:hypothetical protein
MAKFEKGLPRPDGAGRKAGTPNKTTAEFKEAVADLIAYNQSKLQTWLDDVAKDDPAKAFDLLLKMMEFVIPKLSRTEYKEPENQQTSVINIHLVDPKTYTPEEAYKKFLEG